MRNNVKLNTIQALKSPKLYSFKISGEVLTWCQPNTYCSEPVFVPRPDAKSEDDGVLITSVIRGKPEVRYSGKFVSLLFIII